MPLSLYNGWNKTFCCGDTHTSQGHHCSDSDGTNITGGFTLDPPPGSQLAANITGFANSSYKNLLPWQATNASHTAPTPWQPANLGHTGPMPSQATKNNDRQIAVIAGVAAPLGVLLLGVTAVALALARRLRSLQRRFKSQSEVQGAQGTKKRRSQAGFASEVRASDGPPPPEIGSRARVEMPGHGARSVTRAELGS